ncbi:MAG: dihydrodipicolinate synthase family protein [Chloroflexota bacterium]|nr:dihydrodipicolinate synthase family protein [Chloroflexota bacterium]
MTDRLAGILPVLQTALADDGDFDLPSMERQIEFCIRAGADGLVFPVLGSEFMFLSDKERRDLVAFVVKHGAGRIPIIAGVAGASAAIAVEQAAHAAHAGANAVIAMPPYVAVATPDQIFAYFKRIAEAARIPVIIQHAPLGPGMNIAFLKRLLAEVEHINYIKEEMEPSAHHISELVEARIPGCWGIFGGGFCRWMMSELDRGATGFMPAVEIVDIHVQIWRAYQAGDKERAREIFNQIAPLILLTQQLRLPLVKEILVRRGILTSGVLRQPGLPPLDQADHRELEVALAAASHLFISTEF